MHKRVIFDVSVVTPIVTQIFFSTSSRNRVFKVEKIPFSQQKVHPGEFLYHHHHRHGFQQTEYWPDIKTCY